MVTHQKSLILISTTFLPLCLFSYTDQATIKKDAEAGFKKAKENWEKLDEPLKKDVINKALGKDSTITLTKDALNAQYNKLLPAEAKELLDEILTENAGKDTPIRVTTPALKANYEILDEPEEFLKELLGDYDVSERQRLINELLETFNNKDLLEKLPEDGCNEVGVHANPTYVGATHLFDLLNTSYFKGFFQPTMTYNLLNRDTYNEFDTLNQGGLWVEPFGFYTQFRRDAAPLKFNMYTAGVTVGGQLVFFDRLLLGLGVAYSHSGIEWEELSSHASLNSLYFGPSLSYVFSHGYLSCTLFGVANFYDVHRETNLFPKKIEKPNKSTPSYNSWDGVARLEGGLAYEIWNHFFIYPTAKVDYLLVLEQGSSEKLDDDIEISIADYSGSYLSSRAGLKLTREYFSADLGYLIPSLSAGYINFTPISSKNYQYEIEGCKKFSKKVDIDSWNQSYAGAGFALVHKSGFLFSIDYEFVMGADSPLHAANLRVEWSW